VVKYGCGGELVIYDRESGDTHLLNGLSAQIISILQERPHSVEELNAILTDLPDNGIRELWVEQLDAAMLELQGMRLLT
jgi:PqqD family protein of HPr-rel-A system